MLGNELKFCAVGLSVSEFNGGWRWNVRFRVEDEQLWLWRCLVMSNSWFDCSDLVSICSLLAHNSDTCSHMQPVCACACVCVCGHSQGSLMRLFWLISVIGQLALSEIKREYQSTKGFSSMSLSLSHCLTFSITSVHLSCLALSLSLSLLIALCALYLLNLCEVLRERWAPGQISVPLITHKAGVREERQTARAFLGGGGFQAF